MKARLVSVHCEVNPDRIQEKPTVLYIIVGALTDPDWNLTESDTVLLENRWNWLGMGNGIITQKHFKIFHVKLGVCVRVRVRIWVKVSVKVRLELESQSGLRG
jgi:hypothetical protein